MISKGKSLQNANFYLPVLQEFFSFLIFIPKESCCILSSHLSLHSHNINIRHTESNVADIYKLILDFLLVYLTGG